MALSPRPPSTRLRSTDDSQTGALGVPVPPFLQPPLPPGNVSRLPGSGGPGGQRLEDSSWQVPTLRTTRRQQSECCQSLCGRGLLADRDLHPEGQALALTHVQGPGGTLKDAIPGLLLPLAAACLLCPRLMLTPLWSPEFCDCCLRDTSRSPRSDDQ